MKQTYKFTLLLIFTFSEVLSISSVKAQSVVTMALGYRRSFNAEWMGYNSANVIRDSMYLTEPHLMANFPLLHPKIIRYPGGGISNWWDWKSGWFVNSPNLPPSYANLTVKNNGLDSLKKVCNASGATPIFCLNMISSTLKSQLRMLDTAIAKGLTVKYAELGNEFYLDEESDSTYIYNLFPTGAAYGTTASIWCDSIHKHHPDIKVAVQGAFNRNHATRRTEWDTSMYRTLHHEDVVSFHSYFSAAAFDDSSATDTFTMADVPVMLYRPFKMYNILATQDMNLVPAGNEVWITEYNLQDHYKPVHGSWAHGLFIATQTLQYLNDARITHLACHAIDGTAVYGMYFNTGGGFHFGGFDGTFVAPPFMLYDTTQYWGLTAAGRAMKTLGIAIENMKYVSPLEFKDAPPVTTVDNGDTVTFPSVYGWMLGSDTSTHAVIINLSGTQYALKTKAVFPSGGTLVNYSADPTLYVDSERNIKVKNKSIIPFSYNCDPYSITYMRSTSVIAPPQQTVNIVVNGASTFCKNDSVQLDAGSGYVDYEWSTGETTQKIWAKDSGNYTVAVRSVKNSFQVIDTVHLITLPAPDKPKITAPSSLGVCSGATAELDVKVPDSLATYSWSNGTTGLIDIISAAGNYYVTAINSTGCKSSSDITTIIQLQSPSPIITPANPGAACYNAGVTLDGGSGYKSYSWSDGTVGQTQNFKTSGSYTVTVKDSNNCYGTAAPVTITIHEPAEPTLTVEGPSSFCSGTSPTDLKTITGYSYLWSKGGSAITGATDYKYYPTASGTYKVTITDSWGCTKKSQTATITVFNAPGTKITVSGSTKICEGVDTTTLTAKDCSGCAFQWKKNVVNISGATTQTIKVTYAGDYTYAVTNTDGCSATSTKKTIMSKSCRTIPSEISINHSLLLYPNPAADVLHVTAVIPASLKAFITVRNALGEVLIQTEGEVTDGNISSDLPVDHLEDGIYLLQLKGDQDILSRPFIINR